MSLQERLGLTDEEVERLRCSPRSGLALSRAAVLDTGVDIAPDLGVGAAGGGFVDGGADAGVDVGGGGATWGGIHVSPSSGEIDYDGEAAAAAATAAAAAARMREKMTGTSSGGPQTAVGYLLGELRMKPEEVGGLAGIDGLWGGTFQLFAQSELLRQALIVSLSHV